MPELPEVETVVRCVRPSLLGRRIARFRSLWPRNVSPGAAIVARRLRDRTITDVSRRAKYIVMSLDDGANLLVHLRMSGRLAWADETDRPEHVRAWWGLDDGRRLLFRDARKFGRILHTDDLGAATAHLGVEPLAQEFSAACLARLLDGRARQLKPLLLDQSLVAGIGNIYADEALFAAGLHPLDPAGRLDRSEVLRLRRAIRAVLRRGIRCNGASIDWVYPGGTMQEVFRVYGRTDAPCRRCGTPIAAMRVAQRSTHFCPACQPPLAVRRRRSGRKRV